MLFGYQLPSLKNIINLFNWKSILTVQEKDEVELSIATLIDNFIEGDPLGFSSPYFELKLNFRKSVIHIVYVAHQRLYVFLDCYFFILVKY